MTIKEFLKDGVQWNYESEWIERHSLTSQDYGMGLGEIAKTHFLGSIRVEMHRKNPNIDWDNDIDAHFDANDAYKDICNFIVAAINEKLKRDYPPLNH